MDIHFDPPSGSYSAPVKISLQGPSHAIVAIDSAYNTSNEAQKAAFTLLPTYWHISIEHVDRIDEVFEGHDLKLKSPTSKSTFLYDGPFRISRAGKMRVCAWPVGGTYDSDRLVAIYFVENPENNAASRGWVVDKAPASSITHPLTSFNPFSFELSAAQRYLGGKSSSSSPDDDENTTTATLAAEMFMTWSFDRQTQQQEAKQREIELRKQQYQNTSSSAARNNTNNNSNFLPRIGTSDERGIQVTYAPHSQTPTFTAPTSVNAKVSTTWEYLKGIRWSNDFGQSVEERYCIRVDSDCGFTKLHGVHGEWDAIVTTEASLPVPIQLDVRPLAAVNAVIGVHPADGSREGGAGSSTIQTSKQWKEMSCSLHLASSSGIGEEPEVMFRFFSHYPETNLKQPLIEGEVPIGSTLSFRVVPDTSATAALLLQSSSSSIHNSNNNNHNKSFCEVRLYLDGVYISSAFFPKKFQLRATCILSDPVGGGYPALQIVPRAPTTHLQVSNIFLGATPLQSMLEHRRGFVKNLINQELSAAKPSTRGHSDAAHGDPNCSVLFVELKIDVSQLESQQQGGLDIGGSACVTVNFYWRPTWQDNLPVWSVKCMGTVAQSMLTLLSLSGSGRGNEQFEEAPEKSKQSSLMMQI